MFRKDLLEWQRSRRALVVGVVSTALATLGALSAWLSAHVGDVQVTVGQSDQAGRVYSTDPTVTTLMLLQTPIVAVLAIFASMSLLAVERETGSLAWTATKPVSRGSILVAKWGSAIVAFGTVGVALPTVAAATVSTIAYGGVPDVGFVAAATVMFLGVPILYLTLAIALGAFGLGQAAIAGGGMLLLLAPALLGSILPPAVLAALPTGIGAWGIGFVAGEPVGVAVPLAWATTLATLGILSVAVFRRKEL